MSATTAVVAQPARTTDTPKNLFAFRFRSMEAYQGRAVRAGSAAISEECTMLSKTFAATLAAVASLGLAPARACDPNESCHRCLVSAFGHCVQSGNDPICEARKAACQVAPPVVTTPGSPFGLGGPLAQGGPVPGISIQDAQRCVSDLPSCPGQIMSRLGYEAIRPIVEAYIGFLQNQAGNNVRSLDEGFIAQVQAFYPVNLHSVRFATGINTIHGDAITIGNMIYFPGNIDLNDEADAALIYHELQHLVQYARKGGIPQFMTEYVLKSGGSILRGGNSVDIHDNIDLEHEANAKAEEVVARLAAVGSTPGLPAVGNVCRTVFGACLLPGFGPVGLSCFCGTPSGPISGSVTPN